MTFAIDIAFTQVSFSESSFQSVIPVLVSSGTPINLHVDSSIMSRPVFACALSLNTSTAYRPLFDSVIHCKPPLLALASHPGARHTGGSRDCHQPRRRLRSPERDKNPKTEARSYNVLCWMSKYFYHLRYYRLRSPSLVPVLNLVRKSLADDSVPRNDSFSSLLVSSRRTRNSATYTTSFTIPCSCRP